MTVRPDRVSLRKAGIKVLDNNKNLEIRFLTLECMVCGLIFVPDIARGGEFREGWQKCPNTNKHYIDRAEMPKSKFER